MKKTKYKLLLASIVAIFIVGVSFVLNSKESKAQRIERILSTESYSYLPDSAKEVIKENYLQNDVLILTEKNREEDQPYLNPQYVEYLEMSSEERENLILIPDTYVTAWSDNYSTLSQEEMDSLPSSFDLRDVDGKNYLTPIKNQDQLGICWTYAATEQAESYLIKNELGVNDDAIILSPRQIDYATSNNGITNFANVEFGTRKLTSGGSFMHAAQTMAAGLSLVEHNEEIFTTNGKNTLPLQDVLSFSNSRYELKQSASFYYQSTGDNALNPIDDQISYRNHLKNAIMTYGGASVGTEGPQNTCGNVKGENGKYFVRVDGECREGNGHAMQIIGWDDDFDYSYCNVNREHKSGAACEGKTLITTMGDNPNAEKGAWLLRNSWGESADWSYLYLTYDSLRSDIDIITSLAASSSKDWDNEYSQTYLTTNPETDTYGYSYNAYDYVVFDKKTNKKEQATQIKFYALSANSRYAIYNELGANPNIPITTIDVTYPGYQTVDLSEYNITYDSDEQIGLSVYSYGGDGPYYVLSNSTIITTKNLDDNLAIYAPLETTMVPEASGGKYHFTIEFDTANIPSGEELDFTLVGQDVYPNYKIYSDEENAYLFDYENSKVANNKVNVDFSVNDSLQQGVYSVVAYYGTDPLGGEDTSDPYAVAYINIGNFRSEIKYAVDSDDAGTLSVEKEIVDPVSGLLYDGDTLTDKTLTGSTFTPAEDIALSYWTAFLPYEDIQSMDPIPTSLIVGSDDTLVPQVYDEEFFHVYPSFTFYANTKESEVFFTYKSEITGLGDWDGGGIMVTLQEHGGEEVVGELTGTPVAAKTGIVKGVTTDITSEAGDASFYAFDGWYDEDDNLVNNSTYFTPEKVNDKYVAATYTAKWRAIQATLKVASSNLDYGTVAYTATTYPVARIRQWIDSEPDTETATLNDPAGVAMVATPNTDNDQYTYAFSDWSLPSLTVVDGQEAIVSANFTRTTRKYPVTFVNYNNEVLQTSDVEYGTIPAYDGTPAKPQDNVYTYEFAGWDKELTPVTGEVTYKAVFTEVYRNYAVKFISEGTVVSETNYHYGDTIVIPDNPTKDSDIENHYTFVGWTLDGETVANITTVTGSVDYTAMFTAVLNKYTVTFKNYDGTVLQAEELDYGSTPEYKGETPVKPTDKVKIYTFKGWDIDIAVVTGEITYTATFDEAFVLYTVRFVVEGATISEKTDYHYGDKVVLPSAPTKSATAKYTYAFAGWTPEVVDVVEDAEYTATFSSTINKYTVVFKNYDGTVLQTEDLEYGVLPEYKGETPAKSEDNVYTYEFDGWDVEIAEVTSAATYNAKFKSVFKNYTVRFVADSKVVFEKTDYHYGDEMIVPEDPTESADNTFIYTFKNWDPAVPDTVTASAEYIAVFDHQYIDYTIRFEDYDGSEISEATYHYGDEVVVPADPTREADNTYTYEFDGWDSEVTTVIGAHTYVATYESIYIDYTIRFEDYDGSEISEATYHYGDEVVVPADPIRESTPTIKYTFVGWNKAVTRVIESTVYVATYDDALYEAEAEWPEEESFELGSNESLELHIEIPRIYFAHKVTVDGVEVEEGVDYVVSDGSTIIAFQPEFLSTLELGEHSVEVFYEEDVTVAASFTVANPIKVPDTGFVTLMMNFVKSSAIISLSIIGAAVIIATVLFCKKRAH